MDFHFIDDEYVWNIPLSAPAHSGAQFLQSWDWGIFQQTFGRKVHRLQIVEDKTVMASLQLFEHSLPFGKKYLYAPRGPVILADDPEALDTIIHLIKRACLGVGRSVGAVFTRLEPVDIYSHILKNMRIDRMERGEDGMKLSDEMKTVGFRPAPSIQPTDELIVFADKEEDELLAAMREKTRYNIRLSMKHGVRTRLIEQTDYARRVFPFFGELVRETAKRQKIRTHPKEYYSRMVELLVPRGILKLILAEYENKIIAANLLSVFGDTVYYLHGGSSYDNRQLMAPYLLHWEGIKLAKRLQKKYYNLGGVSPRNDPIHQWQNLTRFKEGFIEYDKTGQRLFYHGAFDLVFRPIWYRIYSAGRRVRQLARFR